MYSILSGRNVRIIAKQFQTKNTKPTFLVKYPFFTFYTLMFSSSYIGIKIKKMITN